MAITREEAQETVRRASEAVSAFVDTIQGVRGLIHPQYAPWAPWTVKSLQELIARLDDLDRGFDDKRPVGHHRERREDDCF
jgi:hypothetical protein